MVAGRKIWRSPIQFPHDMGQLPAVDVLNHNFNWVLKSSKDSFHNLLGICSSAVTLFKCIFFRCPTWACQAALCGHRPLLHCLGPLRTVWLCHFFVTPCQVGAITLPLILFARLNKPSFFSLSLWVGCSWPSTMFWVLCWAFFRSSFWTVTNLLYRCAHSATKSMVVGYCVIFHKFVPCETNS